VLDGEVDIIRRSLDRETVIARDRAGNFLGELNLLTGERPYLTARATVPGRVLQIDHSQFRRLLASDAELSALILDAFMARRGALQHADGRSLRIVGSRLSPETHRLREFARRNRLPHSWTDLDEVEDSSVLLADLGVGLADTPVVVTPTQVMRRPTPLQLAEHLGVAYRPTPGQTYDLAVVGAGPAGLAAAVYGASEGLSTVVLDELAAGGQAGASSRIENYLGFPSGIAGDELTSRAAVQAQKFGARLNSPCPVSELRVHPDRNVLVVADGLELVAHAVLIATGARYRKLPLPRWEDFEGAGIYYAATEIESRVCAGSPVVVLGGGNSAGQAALFLAEHSSVTIVIRGGDLGRDMSAYLVERILADPRIDVRTSTVIDALEGDDHLTAVMVRPVDGGDARRLVCRALICFIGAEPATAWLPPEVALDDHGFVVTDRDLLRSDLERFAERPPLPFESSVPGVFAAGDARHGSIKRVAGAVGEGASAVRSIHLYLALRGKGA
jgi:thioredoxin reductase (NADPH)